MTVLDDTDPTDPSRLVEETRVHGSTYTSQAVFDREMDKLFSQGWVYVAHESEIADPGDYVTRNMGREPVIVSRAKDGSVHVLTNRCTHRGNKICTAAAGNTSSHQCPYHGWSFASDGTLVAIPMKFGYHDRHDDVRAELALAECPRVDSYRGFVFASFAADGVTLLEHLGRATTAIDRLCSLSPTGRIELSAGWMKHRQDCNWKMVMENNVDGYHALFTHKSVYEAVRPAKVSHQPQTVDVVVRDMGDGHCEIDYSEEYLKLDEEFVWFGRMPRSKAPEYVAAMEASHGQDEAHRSFVVGPPHTLVFPNLFLAEMNIMVLEPHSPASCVAYTTPVFMEGGPEMNSRILRRCEGAMGPSGFLIADDGEIGARNQMGLAAEHPDWLVLSRGLEDDITDDSGVKNYDKSAETPQRGFWRQWAKAMA
jgi:phenylpropionate dioxygenase-like ring-hydroxylating dioxygenase large terminal subunit